MIGRVVGEPTGDVTRLLAAVADGDAAAQNELLELMYSELRRLARGYMRQERGGHTLQPTALVNEAYMRLLGQQTRDWHNRAHFLAHAALTMRQILVDHARRHAASKRGGQHFNVSLDALMAEGEAPFDPEALRRYREAQELLAIDEALTQLASVDARQARIIELQFFAGLSDGEIARSLDLSERTVRRERRTAKLWLLRRMGPPQS
jgi:RNA polymerase sigma-70 factor (ECF subfamily)